MRGEGGLLRIAVAGWGHSEGTHRTRLTRLAWAWRCAILPFTRSPCNPNLPLFPLPAPSSPTRSREARVRHVRDGCGAGTVRGADAAGGGIQAGGAAGGGGGREGGGG